MSSPTNQTTGTQVGYHRAPLIALGSLVGLIAVLLVFWVDAAVGQDSEERVRNWDSEVCLGCHDGSEETVTFPSGEELGVGVDGDSYLATPHAQIGVQCVHCHSNINRVPHEPITIPDAASFSQGLSTSCSLCHWRQYSIAVDQIHALLPLETRNDTPTCVGCHDPHAAQAVALDHPIMQATCLECHSVQPDETFEAVHVLNSVQTYEADPPPLILFFGLILGAVVAFVAVVWGLVAVVQRTGRRRASSPT